MIKIELVRFEAQDVITTSIDTVKCTCNPSICLLAAAKDKVPGLADAPQVLHEGCDATEHDCGY